MKNFSHLVITAGISAISERNAFGRVLRANPGPLIFQERQQNPCLRDAATAEQAEQHARESCSTKEIVAAVTADPKSVSAEYSLLHTLQGMGRLHDNPTVILLHTDTLAGRISAHAVAELVKQTFNATCRLRPVASFDTSSQKALQAGLGAFMHQVVNELREVDPSYACFAPQGGYKVMTSLGYVAGSFLGYSTAYLHEDNQSTLHIIPAIPIALSPDEKDALGKLARTVERIQEFSKLSEGDQDEVLTHPWLFEVSDDLVVPNALAQFLGLDTQRIFVSPEAAAAMNASHRSPRIRSKLRELPGLIRARQRDARAYLNVMDHERDFTNLNRPGNKPTFHIWKAVSGEVYVAWSERMDGAVLVNRIWVDDHTGYEEAADHATPANSKGLFDDAERITWIPLPDDVETLAEEPPVSPKRRDVRPGTNADKVGLKAKINDLNRQNSAALQRASEFRKEAAKLAREKLELENQVKILRMQLAARSPEQTVAVSAA